MRHVLVSLLATQLLAQVSPDRGERIFQGQCAFCHGARGEGGSGPSLQRVPLRRAPSDDALQRVVRYGIGGTSMPATWLNDGELADIASYVRGLGTRAPIQPIAGNAPRGASVYRSAKAGCARCHMIRGEGGAFAPDLTDIGARRSAAHLRQSLLDPGAAVERGFVIIHAGNVSGVRVNEDTFSVQIRDVAGKVHSLWKAGVPPLRKELGATLMPSYRGVIDGADLDDLVAYLTSLNGDGR